MALYLCGWLDDAFVLLVLLQSKFRYFIQQKLQKYV